MRKITNIEKDCFYLWINKPQKEKEISTVKEIKIGNVVPKLLKETGLVKFKKFFEKNLKKERSVAYKYEKRFSKEKDSKWFIISEIKLTKSKVQGCKEFKDITILHHSMFKKDNGVKPFRKRLNYYVVTF